MCSLTRSRVCTLHIKLLLLLLYVFHACFFSLVLLSFFFNRLFYISFWYILQYTNVSIIIRSCFTVNRTYQKRQRERHKNKYTIHYRKEAKNAISFCVISHLVFVYMIVYISLSLFLYFFSFFLLQNLTFSWNSVYLANIGCAVRVCICMEMPFVIFKSNCHIHLISWKSVYTLGGVHIMPHVISNLNVLVIWNEWNYHFYVLHAICFVCAYRFVAKKIIMNSVLKHVPVDSRKDDKNNLE